MKIGRKLTLSHVLMALVPVALLAGAMLSVFQDSIDQLNHAATEEGMDVAVEQAAAALTDAAQERLAVVHGGKVQDVEAVVAEMRADVEYLARSPRTAEIFEGLKFYHDFGGLKEDGSLNIEDATYATLYDDSERFFGDFLDGKAYDELMMVCAKHGHVLFSHRKRSDLGQAVGSTALKDEGIGRVWQAVNETGAAQMADYAPYSPAGGEQTAFVAAPCFDESGGISSLIVLTVASAEIESIVNDRLGLGDTGDSFLVGRDAGGGTSLRSKWKTMDKNIGDEKQGEFVNRILAGESGSGQKTRPDGKQILVSYSPVDVLGMSWGLVTTQDRHEALSAVDEMVELSAGIGEKIAGTRSEGMKKVQAIAAIMIVVFALLSGGLAWLISRAITRPLCGAALVADAVSQGDLSHRLNSGARDEVGEMARALDRMSEGLKQKADVAAAIAQGDLTNEIAPAGERDEFGLALQGMTRQLNEVLGGIRQAAEQVGAGSREIADSSTSLSQGATEQAASLQEISASMTELNGQVKTNAESAGQADQLSNVARETAATGVDQMKEMTGAMDEISGSSEEIAKIIKVIDDIAFQTNLLALNAAVEAARAGQHGKGFAVVAEEVRNLAGRSAKAARETSQLIEGSLTKVKNGTEIAAQTAESLTSIVESVTKASDLVGEIASASNEQAQGISEVSQGLTQIDTVTQQNTANSEETAAAAEELSSQAEVLHRHIQRFQLRRTVATGAAALRPGEPALPSAPAEDTRPAPAPAGKIPDDFAADREVVELSGDWG